VDVEEILNANMFSAQTLKVTKAIFASKAWWLVMRLDKVKAR
jgi:hypothetical protein